MISIRRRVIGVQTIGEETCSPEEVADGRPVNLGPIRAVKQTGDPRKGIARRTSMRSNGYR
jgi:hypothetical protein